VVDQECCKIVSHERNTDIDQIPQPARHDIVLCARGDDFDECGSKQLVTVEQEVVEEPSGRGTNDTTAKMGEDELERLEIVSRLVYPRVLLRSSKSGRRVDFFVVSVISEPEGHHSHDGERYTECPLCGEGRVWGIAGAVEDEQEDDEHSLVEKLTPT